MFSTFRLPFGLPSFLTGRDDSSIDLEPIPVLDFEVEPERKARTVKHLLKANHAHNAVFYHNLELPNEAPNTLCAAYVLGANSEQLSTLYEQQCKKLDVWPDRIGGIEDDVWRAHEIGQDEWRDFLGERKHQRAFVDFFEDRLAAMGYDWKQLIQYYLYEIEEPLAYSLVSGSSSALIHLATAYRFNSRDIGMEALAMLACLHDRDLPKYSLDNSFSKPSSYESTSSVLRILQRVAADHRFADVASLSQADVLRKREDAVLDHWNSWEVSSTASTPVSARKALEQIQIATVALAVSTQSGSSSKSPAGGLDLLVPLQSAHALRVLLPLVPTRFIVPLLRQWLLSTILLYISAGRPKIDTSRLSRVSLDDDRDKAYKHVRHTVLSGKSSVESSSQLSQALVALAAAEACWGQHLSAEAQQGLMEGQTKKADEMTSEELKTQEEDSRDWWLKAATVLVDTEKV